MFVDFSSLKCTFAHAGTQISEHIRQQLTLWKKGFPNIQRSSFQNFQKEFQEMLQKFSKGFLRTQSSKAHPMAILGDTDTETARQPGGAENSRSSASAIETTANFIMQATTSTDLDDLAMQNRIEQIYKRAVDSGYSTGIPDSNDPEPIVDFSSIPKEDIKILVELFSADDPETIEKMNPSQLLDKLLKYVPRKLIHYLTNISTTQAGGLHSTECEQRHTNCQHAIHLQYTCVQCSSKICKSCCPISRQIYGYGKTTNVFICDTCLKQFYQEHAKEWQDKAHTLIEGGNLEDLKAAVGCIQIALSLFKEVSLVATGQKLLQHNYPELALPFALAVQQQASKAIEKVRANKFLSSVFTSLTTRYDDPNIREELLIGAEEAALLAKSEADHLEEQIADAPSLQTAVDEINQELQLSRRQKEDEEARQIRNLRREIERYWDSRNLRAIIDFILSPDDESQHTLRLKAFEQFTHKMEESISKMRSDDRYSLIFFRGVLKLLKKQLVEGILDIEQVAWQYYSVQLLRNESINILHSLLTTQPSIFTLNGLYNICTQPQKLLTSKGIYNDPSLRELQLFTMDEDKLTPPFKEQWSDCELSATALTHRKCEAAFAKQIQEKKWGPQDVGFAYIDYTQRCVHKDEIAVSLLHASMWFFKDLKENKHQPTQKFAFKKLIFYLLDMAHMIAQRFLHPGMKLYVGRIALAVALQTLNRTEDVALAEDTELISALLHMVTYNSRFVPFWNFPSVVHVSKAEKLSSISAEFHTKYLDRLTETDKKQRPMTEAELQYQLYENDLRYVHKADYPASLHVKAMKELLAEKGWKMSDVSRLMTSPLSPRDTEGWLIQQPKLGLKQEFADIKGMIINLDSHNPSIELVVVPADETRGHVGTCSQTDFQHVLSIVNDEADESLFFSLDQPDNQKRFHPFQEFRYTSESLYESDLLHTMFETDYLMKSFSVGTDVSSNPPFKQRPNKEGLTKNLPKRLQEKLKPVSERGTTQNQAHRFWIQADKIDYHEELNNNRLEIRLGEMDMIIRSHPLIPGEDGKLRDTEEDDIPESPEARFAADMTEVYNELGLHFPMFLRLRQLAKLQVLGKFLRYILQDLKGKSEGKQAILFTGYLTHSKERYASFSNLVRTLCLPHKQTSTLPCKWVPAALHKEKDGNHHSLCYGGVLITPKINKGNVARFPLHSQCVLIPQSGAGQQTETGSTPTQSGAKLPTQSGTKPQTDSTPQTQSQQGQGPKGQFLGTKPTASLTIPKGTKWDVSKKDDKKWTNFEMHGQKAFLLYYGDGNPHARASKLVSWTAVALAAFGVSTLIDIFREGKMETNKALSELSKSLNENPRCEQTQCKSCSRALTKIQPATDIKTTSGLTYKIINEVPMTARYCVYKVQCKKTGKIYIGMTTRQANTRVIEHLRDIKKGKENKILARHFNAQKCFGQFEDFMNITPLAYVSNETMKPYNSSERTRIMEYIEYQLIDLFGGTEHLLNRIKPCISFSRFDIKPKLYQLFNIRGDNVYIDDKPALTIA